MCSTFGMSQVKAIDAENVGDSESAAGTEGYQCQPERAALRALLLRLPCNRPQGREGRERGAERWGLPRSPITFARCQHYDFGLLSNRNDL